MAAFTRRRFPATASADTSALDVNDIEHDAYLADDRTLDDPAVVRKEVGGNVRLRLINGATATGFWLDIGTLDGEVIAVDRLPIVPVTRSSCTHELQIVAIDDRRREPRHRLAAGQARGHRRIRRQQPGAALGAPYHLYHMATGMMTTVEYEL